MTRFPSLWSLAPMARRLEAKAVAWAKDLIDGFRATTAEIPFLAPLMSQTKRGLPRRFNDDDLAMRVAFDEADISAEEAEAALVLRAGHERAQARNWRVLVRDIAQAMDRQAATPGGVRHHALLQSGALLLLDIALRDNDDAAARIALSAFAAAQRADPTCPIRAALAARAHIGVAWSVRGDRPAAKVTAEEWIEMDALVDKAHDILSAFEGDNSPVLAEARYRAAVLADRVQDTLPPLYEAWTGTDPQDSAPMEMHGFYLLPQWGGDYGELERQARLAALRTEDSLGFAGYAMLTLPVLEYDPASLTKIDPALFVEGVDDWLDAYPEPRRVNAFLRHLADLCDSPFNGPAQEFRAYLAEALPDLIARHLRCIVLDAWDGDEPRVRRMIALAYSDHLRSGGTVHLTADRAEKLAA